MPQNSCSALLSLSVTSDPDDHSFIDVTPLVFFPFSVSLIISFQSLSQVLSSPNIHVLVFPRACSLSTLSSSIIYFSDLKYHLHADEVKIYVTISIHHLGFRQAYPAVYLNFPPAHITGTLSLNVPNTELSILSPLYLLPDVLL